MLTISLAGWLLTVSLHIWPTAEPWLADRPVLALSRAWLAKIEMKKEPTTYCTYTLMDIDIEDNKIKLITTERLIILTFAVTSWTTFFWHLTFWRSGFQFALARIRTRVCKDFGSKFLKWFSPLDDRETLYILSPGFCFGFHWHRACQPTALTCWQGIYQRWRYNRVSCQAGIVVSGSVMTSRALPHTILSRRPLTAPTKPLSVNLEPIFW